MLMDADANLKRSGAAVAGGSAHDQPISHFPASLSFKLRPEMKCNHVRGGEARP